jgi:hypothetical protein
VKRPLAARLEKKWGIRLVDRSPILADLNLNLW